MVLALVSGLPGDPVGRTTDDLTRFAWLHGDPNAAPLSTWLGDRADELGRFRADPRIVGHRAAAAAALRRAMAPASHGAPAVEGSTVYSLDREAGGSARRIVARTSTGGAVVVFEAEHGAIDWFFPSPRGRFLAVGTSADGSEDARGRVYDVRAGGFLPAEWSGVRHACVSWLPDEGGFAYTCYPDGRPYGRQIRLHLLGDEVVDDRVLWSNEPESTDWPDVEISLDGRSALIHVSRGWAATDVFVMDLDSGATTPLIVGEDGLSRLHFTEAGLIAGVTEIGSGLGRVVRIDPAQPDPANWVVILAESDVVLDDCSVRDDGVFVVGERDLAAVVGFVEVRDGTAVGSATWADLPPGDVAIRFPTPGRSTMRSRVIRHRSSREAVFTWSSPTRPPALLAWHPGHQVRLLDPAEATQTGSEPSVSTRVRSLPATDGVGIPLMIVEPEGSNGRPLPTLLHGYGGFGLSAHTGYSELAVAWVALGGRYVEAGIRGGRERGRSWHRAGAREQRLRVFDDFADVADELVRAGESRRESLAAWGSSNGGLLMAAMVVRRPSSFAAIHAAVPMTDMLGYHRLSIARLWLSDFGDPDSAGDREWIRAYSPLHNLPETDASLPDILVTTGLHDNRVDPYHAYAFVEALRERDGRGSGPRVLLGVDPHGGHGIGKPADAFVEERADALALFLDAFERRSGRGPTAGD